MPAPRPPTLSVGITTDLLVQLFIRDDRGQVHLSIAPALARWFARELLHQADRADELHAAVALAATTEPAP